MAKKPSPPLEGDAAEPRPDKDEVDALRAMSREDRLALLMRNFDATCGVLPVRRRAIAQATSARSRRKN